VQRLANEARSICCSTVEAPESTCCWIDCAICTSTKGATWDFQNFGNNRRNNEYEGKLELVLTSQALLLLRHPSQDFAMMSLKGMLAPKWFGRGKLLIKKEGKTVRRRQRIFKLPLNEKATVYSTSGSFENCGKGTRVWVLYSMERDISISLSPSCDPIKSVPSSGCASIRTPSCVTSCSSCSSLKRSIGPSISRHGRTTYQNSAKPVENGHRVDAQDRERGFKGRSGVT
jgi:hypothetical protein